MKKNSKLERQLKEFLNSPINRIGRGISKLTVFSITCYAGWWGIVSYMNHNEGIGATPLIVAGTLVAGYTASRVQGYLYNKVAELEFKKRLDYQE